MQVRKYIDQEIRGPSNQLPPLEDGLALNIIRSEARRYKCAEMQLLRGPLRPIGLRAQLTASAGSVCGSASSLALRVAGKWVPTCTR